MPRILSIGPARATRKVLQLNGPTLKPIDLIDTWSQLPSLPGPALRTI
jgi:hypothetical protein